MPSASDYLQIAEQTQRSLERDVLNQWFPRAVDTALGGFAENFSENWSPLGGTVRHIVYQSRLTWLASQSAAHHADAIYGLKFLESRQWDPRHGGLFWAVEPDGTPQDEQKHAYGIAFAIYAAAACFHSTQDPSALELATKTFRWLEKHAHDAKNGGYFEALSRDGTPILSGNGNDAIGTAFGRKSMNTHIHLLEALTTLHSVGPDDTVARRLEEVFDICLEKVYTEPGRLTLYFTPDWQRIEAGDSFGHDVELAFLLVEAAESLDQGRRDRAWQRGRKLIDHALQHGWDTRHGGFFYEADHDINTNKEWWTQAEGLNALLLMHEEFGGETSAYWDAFISQWDFIRKYQIDSVYGGWRARVRSDGTVIPGLIKSDPWTEGYHQGRALMNVTARLRNLANVI